MASDPLAIAKYVIQTKSCGPVGPYSAHEIADMLRDNIIAKRGGIVHVDTGHTVTAFGFMGAYIASLERMIRQAIGQNGKHNLDYFTTQQIRRLKVLRKLGLDGSGSFFGQVERWFSGKSRKSNTKELIVVKRLGKKKYKMFTNESLV